MCDVTGLTSTAGTAHISVGRVCVLSSLLGVSDDDCVGRSPPEGWLTEISFFFDLDAKSGSEGRVQQYLLNMFPISATYASVGEVGEQIRKKRVAKSGRGGTTYGAEPGLAGDVDAAQGFLITLPKGRWPSARDVVQDDHGMYGHSCRRSSA